jgi:catechol 2,3-dioxygenase
MRGRRDPGMTLWRPDMTTTDAFDLAAAPMRIGAVHLKVRDLVRVSEFYRQVLGLRCIEETAERAILGTSATPLLELGTDPSPVPRDPHAAGLFHTAFLLPGRADLARWLAWAVEARVPLHGASDHRVSEAIYLADPEGNGIEVYADRPPSCWRAADGEIRMTTERLDMRDLLAAAGGTAWAGFPEGGRIGHVHLQVGDTGEAERFYRDVLGFEVTSRLPGASFFGSGGYHHQIAGNVWNSRRAGRRPERMAGLDGFEIIVGDPPTRDAIAARARSAGFEVPVEGDALTLRDPWGVGVRLTHGDPSCS